MKIIPASIPPKSRASVVLVILVFLGLMAIIIVSNNLALAHLDKNLRLIERKQLRQAGVAIQVKKPDKHPVLEHLNRNLPPVERRQLRRFVAVKLKTPDK